MEYSLKKYLKAAGGLSNDAFDVLSQYNGLLWCEIESQRNILRELVEVDQGDGSPVSEDQQNGKTVPKVQPEVKIPEVKQPEAHQPEAQQPEAQQPVVQISEEQLPEEELPEVKLSEVKLPELQLPEFKILELQQTDSQPDPEPVKQEKPNAAVGLYDKVVEFLKRQECDELPWVSVYRFRCYVEDISDFQIKYIEYKSLSEQEKNYLLFGNLTKNYSIRKINGEIVGDTSECFEYILNLSEKLGMNTGNTP